MKRVLISGYYGYGNLGDELVLSAIIKGLRTSLHDIHITVLSGKPESTGLMHGVSSVKARSFREVISAISSSDLFISGGGTLLQDISGYRSMLYYLSLLKASVLLRKRTMIFAQGMGPVERGFLRRLARPILEEVDAITLRDGASLDFIRKLGVGRNDIRVTADPVFSFYKDESEIPKRESSGRFLSISVRDFPGFGSRELGELVQAADRIAYRYDMGVRVIVMHPARDLPIAEKLYRMLTTGDKELVDTSYLSGKEDVLSLFRGSGLSICMRLHGLILSALSHVPFISLSNDPKLSAFASKFPDLPSIPSGSFVKESILGSAFQLIERRIPLAEEISKVVRMEHLRQRENYEIAAGLLME